MARRNCPTWQCCVECTTDRSTSRSGSSGSATGCRSSSRRNGSIRSRNRDEKRCPSSSECAEEPKGNTTHGHRTTAGGAATREDGTVPLRRKMPGAQVEQRAVGATWRRGVTLVAIELVSMVAREQGRPRPLTRLRGGRAASVGRVGRASSLPRPPYLPPRRAPRRGGGTGTFTRCHRQAGRDADHDDNAEDGRDHPAGERDEEHRRRPAGHDGPPGSSGR